jgi:hypothetical protein
VRGAFNLVVAPKCIEAISGADRRRRSDSRTPDATGQAAVCLALAVTLRLADDRLRRLPRCRVEVS